MKKYSLLLVLFFTAFIANAQIFNTNHTLGRGDFSLGIQPAILVDGPTNGMLFLHGEAGLKPGLDFGLKLGVLHDQTYFGANLQFGLSKAFVLSAGAHNWGDFGLDATIIGNLPIGSSADLYAGLDLDINFTEPETTLPLFLPIGVNVGLRSNIDFVFEAEIALNDPAYNLIGIGFNFYL